jgi:hypothetical protein
MKNNRLFLLLAIGSALAFTADANPAKPELSCTLKFNSNDWSALYASSEGTGTVTCSGGKSMPVAISAKGLGITAGKWKITDGTGKFTHVYAINDVLGSYLALSGDIGLVKAGTARVLTKGKVSLALAGTGDGFDVGVAVSDFKISRRAAKAVK